MAELDDVLAAWDLVGAVVAPIARGLINQSYVVDQRFVLQRVNPIFQPEIHHNIDAVTRRLEDRGLATPRLVPTRTGGLWLDHAGVWRLQTLVEGQSHDTLASAKQAYAAGELFARWHAALDGLEHAFVAMRLGVHDTARHLEVLRDATRDHIAHPLHAAVAKIASDIAQAAASLPPLAQLPPSIAHGDPKLSNVLFRGDDAVALIDLDTVGPMSLAYELGDAWRSWCNPEREDVSQVRFDLDAFEASWAGYASVRAVDAATRRALLHGVEWVALELSARFSADALRESYFGWDPARYASRGEHNLARARGQWALHVAVVRTRRERARVLGLGA